MSSTSVAIVVVGDVDGRFGGGLRLAPGLGRFPGECGTDFDSSGSGLMSWCQVAQSSPTSTHDCMSIADSTLQRTLGRWA